ncbi:MAG: hypothetical protein P1P81_04705 [Desulfobulbales bacterium]|nr:hypothetical protein [Desulfobulbales bacterium]
MNKSTAAILMLLFAAFMLTGCSSDEESITEKAASKIDEINTRNADAMVKKIKTPIDKARLTRDLGDQRLKEMEKALAEQ